jgi:hypothetical protein
MKLKLKRCIAIYWLRVQSPGNVHGHCHFYNYWAPEIRTKVSICRLTHKIYIKNKFLRLSCLFIASIGDLKPGSY